MTYNASFYAHKTGSYEYQAQYTRKV